ncbi:type II toxin-antitoxin system PemK/MazF family toxin [Streptomyces longwoodensis]
MTEIVPVRGVVYRADLGYGLKPFLVVSNNTRNQNLNDCLVVRLTTTSKPDLPSIVKLAAADAPLVGYVCCDDIVPAYRNELRERIGALSLPSMMRVASALKAALAI